MDDDGRITIGGTEIVVGDHIKILRVHLDAMLSMNKQVTAVAKACNYHICALHHIRPLLTASVARMISYGMVTARMDYCNSLLHGTSQSNIAELHRIQNSLARVVLHVPWRTQSRLGCSPHSMEDTVSLRLFSASEQSHSGCSPRSMEDTFQTSAEGFALAPGATTPVAVFIKLHRIPVN